MRRLRAILKNVEKSESGSVLFEYALISTVIMVSVYAGLMLLSRTMGGMFDVIASGLQ